MNGSTKVMTWVLGIFVALVVVLGLGSGAMSGGGGSPQGSLAEFEESVSSYNSDSPF